MGFEMIKPGVMLASVIYALIGVIVLKLRSR